MLGTHPLQPKLNSTRTLPVCPPYPILLKCPHSSISYCTDPVLKVTLAVTDFHKSLNYWSNLLGMKIYEQDKEKQRALLGYADNQVSDLAEEQLAGYPEFGS